MIRWDYVLAGVAILLAIPSLFAPWYSGPQAIVVASAIAAIALLLAALVVQRNLNRPAISVRAQTTYYVSDMPTQRARLRVEFPPNDQCTSAYLQRRENGVVETFEDGVERDPQGRWLEAAVKNPKGGQEYTVFWHW